MASSLLTVLLTYFMFCPVMQLQAGVMVKTDITCDVCVVGGGSSGFGAALAAARSGASVLVVEKQSQPGGISTSAFVANWEPGPGCSFAREVYERLSRKPDAVAIAPRTHSYKAAEPYGMAVGGANRTNLTYEHTLRRAGRPEEQWCSVVMKPETLASTMKEMLEETGVRVLMDTSFQSATANNSTVTWISCKSGDGQNVNIRAKVFVDATGGGHLCRNVGCEALLGIDPRSRFDEPSAPENPERFLNAISLCYRIQKASTPEEPPSPDPRAGIFGKVAFVYGLTADELIVNPLPLVSGMDLIENGYDATIKTSRLRVQAHWAWLHKYPHFRDYDLKDVAPMLGIRESYRIITDYMLTEHDVRLGLSGQKHDDIVAIADHALDIHGGGHGAKELKEPYGIPYRCLLPRGKKNLLVVGRCAGFSHIAASSCRLSRTMMALGHAAGLAAAEASAGTGDVRAVDISRLSAHIRKYYDVSRSHFGAGQPACSAVPARIAARSVAGGRSAAGGLRSPRRRSHYTSQYLRM